MKLSAMQMIILFPKDAFFGLYMYLAPQHNLGVDNSVVNLVKHWVSH